MKYDSEIQNYYFKEYIWKFKLSNFIIKEKINKFIKLIINKIS